MLQSEVLYIPWKKRRDTFSKAVNGQKKARTLPLKLPRLVHHSHAPPVALRDSHVRTYG